MTMETWIRLIWTSIILIGGIFASSQADLGSCFNRSTSMCGKNRALIDGVFRGCRVLKRFSTMPTKMIYRNGEIYISLNSVRGVFRYDYNTSNLIESDFRMPDDNNKIINIGNKLFKETGSGKALALILNETNKRKQLDLVTGGEKTVDVIDFFKSLIFILSYKKIEGKVEESGKLYVADVDRAVIDGGSIRTKVVDDIETFTLLAVNQVKKELLLVNKDLNGGKLISISLLGTDPCKKSDDTWMQNDQQIDSNSIFPNNSPYRPFRPTPRAPLPKPSPPVIRHIMPSNNYIPQSIQKPKNSFINLPLPQASINLSTDQTSEQQQFYQMTLRIPSPQIDQNKCIEELSNEYQRSRQLQESLSQCQFQNFQLENSKKADVDYSKKADVDYSKNGGNTISKFDVRFGI